MHSHTCPKCQGSMSEGFSAADRQGMRTVSSWHEGEPRKAWWGDVKMSKKPLPIITWRCNRCGFLENYARG